MEIHPVLARKKAICVFSQALFSTNSGALLIPNLTIRDVAPAHTTTDSYMLLATVYQLGVLTVSPFENIFHYSPGLREQTFRVKDKELTLMLSTWTSSLYWWVAVMAFPCRGDANNNPHFHAWSCFDSEFWQRWVHCQCVIERRREWCKVK